MRARVEVRLRSSEKTPGGSLRDCRSGVAAWPAAEHPTTHEAFPQTARGLRGKIMMAEARDTEELVFDLVVVGGGLAGLCAALAAARAGARTALVQDRPVLGGNSSSEIRVVPYGAGHSNAWARETGLVGELILEDRATNPDQYLDHGLTNSNYDLTLLHAARRESHLTLFLNTSVRAVEVEEIAPVVSSNEASVSRYERRIVSVSGSQLVSEREYCFRARHFIDATGDGTVGFLAGADYRYGREARAEHGEPLAPATADEVTMGSTLTFRAHDTGKPAPFVAPLAAYPYRTPEDFIYDRGFWGVEQPAFGGYWWIEICNPYHQIADNPTVRDELHRHVLGIWDYLKNHSPQREHLATYALDWIGMLPGKRESRRLLGDVIVTEHDCHRDREWPDGVCYAGWWIDLHIPGGLLNRVDPGEREDVDQNYKHWIRVAPFSLPLRALYSRNVENLWMTGRDVSVTHVALGPMRVQLSLGAQGQAVGTAAAYAVAHDLTPREAAHPPGTHLSVIRQQLLREDVRLLGVPNEDPADLALRAEATATSAAGLDFG
ncbi:MAG: FAD-dependent oxidoreductase, partial [candidate division WS1 bacterium]|nr:FAD-dependent oxidoreductase [candidate division WS1 bacterium]